MKKSQLIFQNTFSNQKTERNMPVSFLLIVILLISVLLSLFHNETSVISEALKRAQITPFDKKSHYDLAQLYYNEGKTQRALNELDIAETLTGSNFPNSKDVLAESNEIVFLRSKILEEPKKIAQKLEYWQKIIQQYPNYRDAWVQLYYLNKEVNSADAEKHLKKIEELDPNYVQNLKIYLP